MKKPFVIFSKRLERGTLIWLLICTLVVFLPRIEAYFYPSTISYSWSYTQERKAFKRFQTPEKTGLSRFKPLWKRCAPESLNAADWQRLGLSSKQSASIIRYRDKYGLHSLAQMQRIRVLPSELLQLIADSLRFDTPMIRENQIVEKDGNGVLSQKKEKQLIKLELNGATEVMLVALPGIGAYSASKIIAYRDRLGGFLALDQLSEIPGLKPEIVQQVLPFLELKQGVTKMMVNEVGIETLRQHPYLTWNQANSIIKMRKQRGAFKQLQELKESVLIDEETYKKLLPYLSL
jgi:DNA uptake protein ComE-like DNA-binding protein